MNDLISRQAAIDAYGDWYVEEGTEEGFIGTVKQLLEGLPSAQSETHDEHTEMHAYDLISRQEAVEAVENAFDRETILNRFVRKIAISAIRLLPSAGPEPLTDKEQRIFLAAMSREEEVCKQVDDECRAFREPYEDSLVRTCHEITRKVKSALWTI